MLFKAKLQFFPDAEKDTMFPLIKTDVSVFYSVLFAAVF